MTWGSRLKLVAGLILVLLVVAAATIVFNQRQTQVLSTTAQIEAEHYDVGTDYPGLVISRDVEVGDAVAAGDTLIAIESPMLLRDIAQGVVPEDLTSVGSDGTVVIRASVDGTVSALDVDAGGYASAGGVVATIDKEGTMYVAAEFLLDPHDFACVPDDATVDLRLPDGSRMSGTVADLEVATVDGAAHVTARIVSDALASSPSDGLVRPGTPLEATLRLTDDGPLAGPIAALGDLARKVGL